MGLNCLSFKSIIIINVSFIFFPRILIFLQLNLPLIVNQYEVFKDHRENPIHFIKSNHHARHYMISIIGEKLTLNKKLEFNKKFTNNFEIDNQLNEILELFFKNQIHPWLQFITGNEDLSNMLYLFFNHTLSTLITRIKLININDLLTIKFVDELIKHQRLFRLTKSKLQYKIHTNEELIQMFFNFERKSEKSYFHEKVCSDQSSLILFLSRICDVFQFSLFPIDSFKDETFKIITKEIFIKLLVLPIFDTLSEPDFINKIIISLLKTNYPTTETFISILQSSHDGNELRAVLESVENEILFVRSKDQDDDDLKMKQQLSSLLYLKKIILSHLKKFDVSSETTSIQANNSNDNGKSIEDRISISFDTIIRHSVALQYFTEYMSTINAEHYISFYINVQTFKISIEQGLFEIYLTSVNDSITNEQYQQLQNDVRYTALNIYETYLLPNSSSYLALIDQQFCQQLNENLNSDDSSQWMSDSLFDDIFFQVRDIILTHENYFPAFRKSKYYRKLLAEPDLLRDSLEDEDDITGLVDIPENNNSNDERNSIGFNIDIIDTGILNLQGKSFIGYLINIERKNGENWTILRRYSEFFNFHQLLLEKCVKYHLNLKNILFLPPKNVLNNQLNDNFIQYRKYMLNLYLKRLNYLHEKFLFLREDIEKFLHPGNYDINASKSIILNPIKTIGNVFKNQSESILDGFQKLTRTLSLQTDLHKATDSKKTMQTNSLGHKITSSDMKLIGASDWSLNLNNDNDSLSNTSSIEEENVPLLLLLDEIFDLKSQNFWLRRRIIEILKQVVEVAFSDTINKKLLDYINEMTSTNSISQYLDSFK